jgi:hypothetical protein
MVKMKVGLFFSGEIDDAIRSLLRLCRREGIEASAYRFRKEWNHLEPTEVAYNFGALSHVMLRGTRASLEASWLPFIAGFVLGRGGDSCVLGPLEVSELPEYLRHLPVLEEEAELESYLREEKLLLDRESSLEAAREEIRASGLPETEEAFAGAVAAGNRNAALNFLRIGFSPDSQDAKGVPLLVLAIRNNNPEVGKLLLEREADANAVSDDRGTTALMEAASLGDTDIVEMLLSHGADPNIKSKSGRTALMLAVSEGHRDAASALIDAGSELSIVDDLGMTAGAYAKLFKLDDLFVAPEQT